MKPQLALKSACELASKNGIDTSGYLHHIQTYSNLRGPSHNADGFMIHSLDADRIALSNKSLVRGPL